MATDDLAQYSLSAWAARKNGLFPHLPLADGEPGTTYDPSFFNTTDAADDPTFDGYIENDTHDFGFDTTAYIGPNILSKLHREQYIDCNNNGNIEWTTTPSVSQAFAESIVETFCNNINNQNTDMFAVPNTANYILFLGAILQIDDPTCTSLTISPSDCIEDLGKLINGCDTNSTSRKYGGVCATEYSITYEYQSTDGNGYRLQIFNDLARSLNNTVDIIGSVQAGTMADNNSEGHVGATIDEIASFATQSLSQLTEENIVQFNTALPGVAAERVAKGFNVLVVDMFTKLTYPDDYADYLHPDDAGYVIMSNVWYNAMGYADSELNWISPPVQTSSRPGHIECANLPTWYPEGEIADGVGLGANVYPDIVCNPL
ncbi:hypothetical protein ACMFMF_007997 [Clarireedia jacksonii]